MLGTILMDIAYRVDKECKLAGLPNPLMGEKEVCQQPAEKQPQPE